ncbi:SDR family NAD(P)-dependent oxidoreductase [Streptomyces hainanensis]|uniref:SDR family NAD(P)-dependent oxidoreductase n=1 Tax=Streptomyces hainanensis TaxID=402648 RepID=A0A4V2Y3J7_9ACTN|nr:SDR family NAD(P)-dependent oxidoreductase [Streptomyces hainanensis]TDC76845.1 SDR family NAD(P)-dependent oxidoreductase [Streptomyces hainanensis]
MNRSSQKSGRTVIVQGGTDGIGRELARALVARGDRAVVLGRDRARGAEFEHFVPADLSLVAENRRVVAEVTARFPTVDALVLCARHFRSFRRETADGFEDTFALFYLSRFLLAHGLLAALERSPAAAPAIINVAGPGAPLSLVNWDDLQFVRGYEGQAALFQGGKLNDLLGVDLAARGHRTRQVLYHPGTTATGFSGEYDAATEAHIAAMKRAAKPAAPVARHLLALLDAPPAEPLSAFVEERRIGVGGSPFDPTAAARLRTHTDGLLSPFRDPADEEPSGSAS